MKLKLIAAAILVIALALIFLKKDPPAPITQEIIPQKTEEPQPDERPPIPAPNTPLGNQFLDDYGSPGTPPSLDLEKVGRVIEGISTLIKNIDTRLIATNEQLAAFLRGKNIEGMIYVSPDQPIFNDDGKLVDRWGTPLIVHPLRTNIIEIRSAGPDKIPYNDDDFIRDPTGGVYQGSDPKSPTSLAP